MSLRVLQQVAASTPIDAIPFVTIELEQTADSAYGLTGQVIGRKATHAATDAATKFRLLARITVRPNYDGLQLQQYPISCTVQQDQPDLELFFSPEGVACFIFLGQRRYNPGSESCINLFGQRKCR